MFEKSLEERASLIRDPEETCIRLFSGMYGNEDSMTIDLYGEYVLFQNFTDDNFFMDLSFLHEYLNMLLEKNITVRGVLAKDRRKTSDLKNLMDFRKSTLLYGEFPPDDYTVKHLGCSFSVDLVNSQHTGLFADMRNARRRLAPFYSPSSRMLNLFCYTGAFSVHALKNGIMSAVNVDLSKNILSKAKHNYLLNGLSSDDRDFIHEDSLAALKYLTRKNRKFNFAVFDPPTFSRNKKGTFSIDKNYADYLDRIYNLLEDEGLLFSCINTYNISREEYLHFHSGKWELLFLEHEAEDFISGPDRYLKCGLWRKVD